ncbi:hypothetical protein M8C13_19265 [Crossiella sp. SN42]|uniref:hypothetical protein n=1 Tax=Crossiella sp. SN42 TaxID=2944808 RepID=UPI00207D6674|nr:hypothetical protein [Crossiella sp. SN42]MCO1577897.1 hypothetical protein [Crossiella sp. SN42]
MLINSKVAVDATLTARRCVQKGPFMRFNRKILSVVATAAAAVLMSMASAAPSSAAPTSPAPASATPAALAHCPNGVMEARYDANVYSGWNSFRVIGHVKRGDRVACNTGYDLGRRYTACGVTKGNGWVRLVRSDGVLGWSPQGCFADL